MSHRIGGVRASCFGAVFGRVLPVRNETENTEEEKNSVTSDQPVEVVGLAADGLRSGGGVVAPGTTMKVVSNRTDGCAEKRRQRMAPLGSAAR